ncbi:MAG: hypothetical protein ACO1OT_17395 [Heyndrickxia sp.]|jgi:hypothetical protein
MTQWPIDLKKTPYKDINELLLESYHQRKEVERLQKEIQAALSFNPENDIVFYEGYFWKKVKI